MQSQPEPAGVYQRLADVFTAAAQALARLGLGLAAAREAGQAVGAGR